MTTITAVDEKYAEQYVKRLYDPEGSFSYQKVKAIVKDVKKQLNGDTLTVIVTWLIYTPIYLRPPLTAIQEELEVKFGATIADYVMKLQPKMNPGKMPTVKDFQDRVENYSKDPVTRKIALAMFLNDLTFTPVEAWKAEWLEACKAAAFKLAKAELASSLKE
jgi:hypothetical protein